MSAPATCEYAIGLAVDAHRGMRDKQGMPAILHVLRVVGAVDGLEAKTVAALHDIVEDTSITLGRLAAALPPEIVDAVDAITRRESETYMEYIARLAPNALARVVKIADLRENHARGADFPTLRDRYEKALAVLEAWS